MKLILFAGVIYVLYSQINQFDKDAWDSFKLVQPLSFILAVVFVFPNIYLGYLKWKIIDKKEIEDLCDEFYRIGHGW